MFVFDIQILLCLRNPQNEYSSIIGIAQYIFCNLLIPKQLKCVLGQFY